MPVTHIHGVYAPKLLHLTLKLKSASSLALYDLNGATVNGVVVTTLAAVALATSAATHSRAVIRTWPPRRA